MILISHADAECETDIRRYRDADAQIRLICDTACLKKKKKKKTTLHLPQAPKPKAQGSGKKAPLR